MSSVPERRILAVLNIIEQTEGQHLYTKDTWLKQLLYKIEQENDHEFIARIIAAFAAMRPESADLWLRCVNQPLRKPKTTVVYLKGVILGIFEVWYLADKLGNDQLNRELPIHLTDIIAADETGIPCLITLADENIDGKFQNSLSQSILKLVDSNTATTNLARRWQLLRVCTMINEGDVQGGKRYAGSKKLVLGKFGQYLLGEITAKLFNALPPAERSKVLIKKQTQEG